ncbi:hypothetical protein J7L48_04505, partial [bacterium]|nr:hypothetical protein [bacterium]
YHILGNFTQKDQNFLILENGKTLRSSLKLGIKFRLNEMNNGSMQDYLKFLNTKLENLNRIKSITINKNYNTIYLKDGFILKVDRNLNGLKNLAYKKIIKKYIHDRIKGFDLRYKDMIILILEA